MPLTHIVAASSAADLATYTYTATSLGTATAQRKIVIGVVGRDTGTTATLTGVTVGGFAATQVINQRTAAIDTSIAALYSIDAGTGSDLDGVTSADIVLTFSEAMLRSSINIFHLDGAYTLFDTGFTSTTASGATQTVSIDIPANSAVLSLGVITTVNAGSTWTGLTERSDQHIESNLVVSAASDVFTSAQTGLIATMTTFNPEVIERIIIAASWGGAALIAAGTGSYVLGGTPANLQKTGAYAITALPGDYTLTGTAATPRHTAFGAGDYFGNRYFGNSYFGDRYWGLGEPVVFSVVAAPGSYTLTGADVALQRTGHLALSPALPGDYTLTGTAATPRHTAFGTGDYFGNRYFGNRYFGDRYWGIGEPVIVAYSVTAEPGSYTLTGHDVALQRTGHLALSPALPGSYVITGTDAVPFITAVPVTPPTGVQPDGGGKKGRRWIKGAPYPWLQIPQDDDLDEPLEKVKVTLPLVEEALEEIQLYDGVPAWWALQNAKRVKREIPEYVYVPEREDHVAVLHAIMQKIADDAIAKRLAEERDDEEALLLLLS